MPYPLAKPFGLVIEKYSDFGFILKHLSIRTLSKKASDLKYI